eukprot:scaffold65_cov348-Pavlova_lutheri.AAC.3
MRDRGANHSRDRGKWDIDPVAPRSRFGWANGPPLSLPVSPLSQTHTIVQPGHPGDWTTCRTNVGGSACPCAPGTEPRKVETRHPKRRNRCEGNGRRKVERKRGREPRRRDVVESCQDDTARRTRGWRSKQGCVTSLPYTQKYQEEWSRRLGGTRAKRVDVMEGWEGKAHPGTADEKTGGLHDA